MATNKHSIEELVQQIQDSGAEKIKAAIVDIDGVLRGKYIHIDKFKSAMQKGFGFCNVVFGWDAADVCYDNVEYTGWHTGYPDAEVRLDPGTFRRIPWDSNTPFLLGDFVDAQGQPLPICPRQLLKCVIARARSRNYEPMIGVEFEFFNFRETPESLAEKGFRNLAPITPGMFGYSLLRSSYGQPYFSTLMDEMGRFEVPLEGLHTETGPGVYEAAIGIADALEAGDRAVLFKTSAKEIAYRFGVLPTFMARWNLNLPGSSGHVHQSLWDVAGERNLFYDEQDSQKMSPLFKSYLAGLLHCLPDILPMFAPTVNSYKRLVEGFWAPTRVSWGLDNRTAAMRVILGPSSKSTRVEGRVSGADINPYLALAAYIAAGLYGIEKNLPLSAPPVGGNAYQSDAPRLPSTLFDAATKMRESKVARELFGDAFVDHFTATRLWEWRQAQLAVTDWELQRYLEII
ncbi:MAG: glutamine synthetase family protein [Leptospirales bacterium]|nr:glutamine synthetase family protein [Leptospirales bacterium]